MEKWGDGMKMVSLNEAFLEFSKRVPSDACSFKPWMDRFHSFITKKYGKGIAAPAFIAGLEEAGKVIRSGIDKMDEIEGEDSKVREKYEEIINYVLDVMRGHYAATHFLFNEESNGGIETRKKT